jgi:predicted Zn-dependent peptidase
MIGFPAVNSSRLRDVCAMDTLLAICGDTYRGRISSALTSAKIPFDVVLTDFVTQKYPGLFYVLVSISPSDEDKAASVVLGEFRKLATLPVGAGELAEGKARVEGGDLYELETFSGQARLLGMYETIASYDQLLDRKPTIDGLTASDITSTAKTFFSGDNYTLVVLEPEDKAKTASGQQ